MQFITQTGLPSIGDYERTLPITPTSKAPSSSSADSLQDQFLEPRIDPAVSLPPELFGLITRFLDPRSLQLALEVSSVWSSFALDTLKNEVRKKAIQLYKELVGKSSRKQIMKGQNVKFNLNSKAFGNLLIKHRKINSLSQLHQNVNHFRQFFESCLLQVPSEKRNIVFDKITFFSAEEKKIWELKEDLDPHVQAGNEAAQKLFKRVLEFRAATTADQVVEVLENLPTEAELNPEFPILDEADLDRNLANIKLAYNRLELVFLAAKRIAHYQEPQRAIDVAGAQVQTTTLKVDKISKLKDDVIWHVAQQLFKDGHLKDSCRFLSHTVDAHARDRELLHFAQDVTRKTGDVNIAKEAIDLVQDPLKKEEALVSLTTRDF
jgi:hypothetical protein